MRVYVVDAFTDRPFAGNPAGVCPLTGPADAGWMQRVAAELNLSETAFPRPVEDPDADYELRWFTPAVEVALCGHATLGAAHVLYETGAAPGDRPIRFRTLHSGVLTVRREDDLLAMDFPAVPPVRIDPPAGLAEALAAEPLWTGRNAQHDILALLPDAATVRSLRPDRHALGRIDARGICVTAPGEDHDFVSRFFAPRVGVPEDPVTGSAHCMLGPYWAERLGRADLLAHQASARGGDVRVSVRDDRVILRGAAVTVIEGGLRA
ncbi:PhzF family phenazine biosynthesis protein [Actinoallomurus rhizosphaericola]|uniref:PhzF family phenazine biosynthesis protein n=1 Tax=Actinoallomurus rhizosphaericola TaxID=2952536 RepID=UPI0020925CCD|nr:PhzF family phenazine biosynthesis protein [Actinoallomurus rhizosphaericola]MCO5999616.1 PhzF family phenazine biosynthesis protein [Actinoallomurus rhizosphaericola]